MMLRRDFLGGITALWFTPQTHLPAGEKLAIAARTQIGVTTGYDPAYVRLSYPNGDVPLSTGVCADVVVRAARSALTLDLQQLVHEDMLHHFAAYPSHTLWGNSRPDANIDHRRVPNLETYWQRAGAAIWSASSAVAGDAFPKTLKTGDLLTWRLNARLPHIGIVSARDRYDVRIIHNVGAGVEEISLAAFRSHRANGHYRWPAA
jgi:uncharacterized protein YijF (DUF1287 family)